MSTRRFGREFVWLEEVDSTNRWMADHLGEFNLTGGVVAANHQTAGQGRQSRKWFDSPNECLLFSLALRFSAAPDHIGLHSLLPAIAIARAAQLYVDDSVRIALKWPNDVRLNDRKVAGILGQHVRHEGKSTAIIGVGVNISALKDSFPENLTDTATSFLLESGSSPRREPLLADILREWEDLFDAAMENRKQHVLDEWLKFGPAIGSRIIRTEGNVELLGTFVGIGERGQLLLRDESGIVREIFSGDIAQ